MGLVLGTDFISDVLLVSFRVTPPLRLRPSLLATDVALRTISEALTRAACARLELDESELQAEYRPALTVAGREGLEAEIYLYDTLPGGAGFARRIGAFGLAVFEDALRILEECPEGCDRSCYRCLRSFRNKFEHGLLDRHVGASLLRFVLSGAYPTLDAQRVERATGMLIEDLQRQGIDGLTFTRDGLIQVPGLGDVVAPIVAANDGGANFVIAMSGPLTPGVLCDERLRDLQEYSAAVPVIPIDELLVRRNLPRATADVLTAMGRL
jgi:hypothetical protein